MKLLTKLHYWLDKTFGLHKKKHFWGKIAELPPMDKRYTQAEIRQKLIKADQPKDGAA